MKKDYVYDETVAKKGSSVVTFVNQLFFLKLLISLLLCILFNTDWFAIAIPVSFIALIIWENYYDNKTHFTQYEQTNRRSEVGIKFCPRCGGSNIEDINSNTVCADCNYTIKF